MFLSVTEAMVHKLFTQLLHYELLHIPTQREGERHTHTQSSATFMQKKSFSKKFKIIHLICYLVLIIPFFLKIITLSKPWYIECMWAYELILQELTNV